MGRGAAQGLAGLPGSTGARSLRGAQAFALRGPSQLQPGTETLRRLRAWPRSPDVFVRGPQVAFGWAADFCAAAVQ